MSLIEVLVALGLVGMLSMAVMTVSNHLVASRRSANQLTELSSLMTDLRFFMKNDINCTQNLLNTVVPNSPVVQVPINSTGTLTYQTGNSVGQPFVQANWNYPAGSGPLHINKTTDSPPGLALQYKGTLNVNTTGSGGTLIVDLVVNATQAGGFGSPLMSNRLPLTVSVNTNRQIVECFATSQILGKYLMDDVCGNTYAGTAYSPQSGSCIQSCYPGTGSGIATCPTGSQVVSCQAVGGTDPNGGQYQKSITYAGTQTTFGPSMVNAAPINKTTCGCYWAQDAVAGTCQACCSSF